MKETLDVAEWKEKLREFARERDWEQFHTPKNLAMALSVEASELMEIYQWTGPCDAVNLDAVRDEIADVLLYALRLSDILHIDVHQALAHKMEKNAAKYPAQKVRGSAKKYSEW